MKIPANIKKYFWDTDPDNLKLKGDSYYIISRLLEYGNVKAIKWLLKIYPKKTIKITAKKSRNISDRTKAFWGNIKV